MTYVVGQECGEGEVYAFFPECDDMFGSMPKSMFTLFQLVTLESWAMAVARPVVYGKPWLISFFVVFLYLTTFGLMNIVMGVIVEQTRKSAEENNEKLLREKHEQQRRELNLMGDIFRSADVDKGGTVSREEFLNSCL